MTKEECQLCMNQGHMLHWVGKSTPRGTGGCQALKPGSPSASPTYADNQEHCESEYPGGCQADSSVCIFSADGEVCDVETVCYDGACGSEELGGFDLSLCQCLAACDFIAPIYDGNPCS